jgi:hypothetical protein
MSALSVIEGYFAWHYSTALKDYLRIWGNYLWFITRLFSMETLVRTLFSPWRRLGDPYPDHFDLELFLSSLVVNTLMRAVGFVFRILTLLVGLLCFIVLFIMGIVGFFLWIALPVALPLVVSFSFVMFTGGL